ncbi:metalloprotease PmbA [Paludibacterium yongneupense]|uniref:metalloprotease PmbA n=1 Tax=Paludibacterium yongneupense TaxID=400061 RepID=UPI0003FDC5F5|nr:metalloprotease PmbA [Paludibacterium yongneupense]
MSANTFSYSVSTLETLAARVLDLAKSSGATASEVDVSEGLGQSVSVRLEQVETIEYNQDKGIGVTVYFGQKKGHASTSDFSDSALVDTVAAAVNIARYTAPDDCSGLAEPELLARDCPDLDLYHAWNLSVEDAIAIACRCERAARGVDARISNSEGATVSAQASQFIYGNSNGFLGGFASSRHSVSAAVVADDGTAMQRDYWYSAARHPDDLLDAETVGRIAGERAVRRLGGRRIKTGSYPVIFEANVASSLIGHLVSAISGGSLYRQSSFLLDSLGKTIFSPIVTIDEDPFLPRGLASSAFDNEGVATRGRRLVDAGVLNGYMLGSYSARKLGMKTTGNAGGAHNLMVHSTGHTLAQMLAGMGSGLLVTEVMGQGVNTVTGDYSRGAAGFWVENGEIAFPVEEITIAGHLNALFKGIVAIGNDTQVRGATHIGSVWVDALMVAGEA